MKVAAALLAIAALIATPAIAKPPKIQVAITVDDLPAHSALSSGVTRVAIAADFLEALKNAKTGPVYGFVNGVQLEREPASADVLSMWRAAGHPLGNHTWTHLNLAQMDPAAFEAEVARNEPLLEKLADDSDWRWLRFPFLSEGETLEKRTAVRALLKARGYHIASVTLSFDDWAWNAAYARCVAKNDQAAIVGLENSYLKAAEDSLAYSRGMSAALYGKDIPYVLLMHLGAFDARMAPRLLALYQSLGVTFTPLEQAERHPFYKADLEAMPSATPVTLENAMAARGLRVPKRAWNVSALDAVCP
jgi:peptidoglycan/xylan/chitin deacetylase (PgdA/CDA1 family)